jgi:NPCBM-associated, NEW3 domain of alpha-galactosidase
MAEPSNGPTGWGRIRRGLVALGATALTAFAVSAVSAGAAQAQDEITFTFDEVRANFGDAKGIALIDPGASDDPATLTGEIDTATGDFTIPVDGVSFPPKTLQIDPPAAPLPVDAVIEPTAAEPITGNLDTATGDLDIDTMNLSVLVSIFTRGSTTDPLGLCRTEPVPTPLASTGEIVDDDGDPPTPVTYSAAPFAPPSGEGAGVATWASLPATTQEGGSVPAVACPAVDGLIGGPGGIWMSGMVETGPAGPEPFSVEFNHGQLKLGQLPELEFLSDAEPATFDGTIDPATGEFTVPVDGVVLPPISAEVSGLPVTVTTVPQQPVTGTFDEATGDLDMAMLVDSTANVSGTNCTFEDFQWNFSTDNTTPFQGAPFADGLDGAGATVANWTDIPPVTPPGGLCDVVRNLAMGPGGLLFGRELGPPPAPDLALSVSPRRDSVKQGKSGTFTARVRNTGDAGATGVRVCMTAPRKAVQPAQKCVSIGALAAGASDTARFRVKAKRNAKPKSYSLRFRATGTGGPDNATATLKVKRR